MKKFMYYIAVLAIFIAFSTNAPSLAKQTFAPLIKAASTRTTVGMPVKFDVYGRVIGEEFFYWRSILNEEEQIVYDQIYAHALILDPNVPVSADISVDRTLNILEAVRYDNPELFWLDYSLVTYYNALGVVVSLELSFCPEAELVLSHYDTFIAHAEAVLSVAADFSNDADKVKFIHDYLIETNDYTQEAERDQSAFGAIVTGKAVCMGYSLAFEYYMQRLGIPCALVTGEARGESHAWNLVKLGGEYYNIDPTWNDPIGNPPGSFSYNYFNLTDAQITDRVRTPECNAFPAANGTWYAFDNYYGSQIGSDFSLVDLVGLRD